MKAIIEVTGRLGAGKTSVVITLGEELSPDPILYIDACPDQRLTIALAPKAPELTLSGLFVQNTEATGNREAVDWAFNDLTVSVGEEQELITVGPLPESIDETSLGKLRYGLTRLMEGYDFVIIDGHHPILHSLLPEEYLRLLDIVTPNDFSGWQVPPELERVHTPALILNRYADEALPPALETALNQQQVQLIGKLPQYSSAADQIRQFPDAFRNCLLRLNIPLHLNPQ